MSLSKDFFNRNTNITAKVIADSISDQGIRITTLEVEYPRFIHGEVMTHRSLSKNSSSSRAIPIQKMLYQIENNMAIPVYWGKNKSGMQAVEEVSHFDEAKAVLNWERSYNYIKDRVLDMVDIGLHKQVPNRLSEPFQMMKVVITGTDWDNFFNLRIHKDAQPEICMLAYKIYEATEESKPNLLKDGEWHLPYVNVVQNDHETYYNIFVYDEDVDHTLEHILTLEDAIKISASCCAQVSYRNTDMSLEKADKIFNMLIKADVLHASCFEHLATPITEKFEYFDKSDLDTGYEVNFPLHPDSWEKGVTHVNYSGVLCSGNLTGWISYRQKLSDNTCYSFDFKNRMEDFEVRV